MGRGSGCQGLSEAEASPSHQILGIEDSDDVLGTTQGVVDRNAGMLLFDDAGQGFVEREVAGQRKDVRPWHHDLAHRDAFELKGVVNHLFLERGDLSELAAGGDDKLEFVGRMYGALPDLTRSKNPQYRAGGGAHGKNKGPGQGEENF